MKSGLLRIMKHEEAKLFAGWEKAERPYPWSEKNFLETNRGESSRTLVWAGKKAMYGYAALQVVEGEAYLLNIMVEPALRRQGRGRELVKRLVNWARREGVKNIILDVNPDNVVAYKLYLKSGFKVVA